MRRGAFILALAAVGWLPVQSFPSPVVAETVAPEGTRFEAVCATVPANAEAAAGGWGCLWAIGKAIIACDGDDVDHIACAEALTDVYKHCKGPVEDYVRCIKESDGGWKKYWECLGLQ